MNAEIEAPTVWPPADLPSNIGSERYEFGILLDRRDQGLGVTLLATDSDVYRALNIAAKAGSKAHVRRRVVTRSPWSAPIWDDRDATPTPPGTDEATGGTA